MSHAVIIADYRLVGKRLVPDTGKVVRPQTVKTIRLTAFACKDKQFIVPLRIRQEPVCKQSIDVVSVTRITTITSKVVRISRIEQNNGVHSYPSIWIRRQEVDWRESAFAPSG